MKQRRGIDYSNFQIFSDMALLMLVTFIFLLVVILITSRLTEQYQTPKLKEELQAVKQQLIEANKDKNRLTGELGEMANMGMESQIDRILETASAGKKDFDLFIDGLRDIPGKDIHLVIDVSGSMHGVTTFLIPVLRVIVLRSGKELSALTWFANGEAKTYTGTMGEMFDQLMQGAPFSGSNETIGDAFARAAKNAPTPGAYVLIGDEPSDDRIYYLDIPSPVFTLPIGKSNPNTTWEYQMLADKTKGRMLHLKFE